MTHISICSGQKLLYSNNSLFLEIRYSLNSLKLQQGVILYSYAYYTGDRGEKKIVLYTCGL